MVSSTFYDLRQVREDLRRFIADELGFRALLSEHPSFPINPDLTTIENCRERVNRDADILVLLIGRHYGSLDERSDVSVTNLEYLAARAKGIPVYSFVERGLLPLLPVWRTNPDGAGAQVDTPRVFEFLDRVRRIDAVWMQEFDRAQEIIDGLRVQFAYQHQQGLRALERFRAATGSQWLEDLKGETLRIALERGELWEHRLFAHALIDATSRFRRLRRRHQFNVALGPGEDVADVFAWIHARMQDALRLAGAINGLINSGFTRAMRPAGEPASAEEIVFIADSLGDVYAEALRWHARLLTAHVPEAFETAVRILATMVDEFIDQIEAFGPSAVTTIRQAQEAHVSGKQTVVTMTLRLSVSDASTAAFSAEMRRLRLKFGLPQEDES